MCPKSLHRDSCHLCKLGAGAFQHSLYISGIYSISIIRAPPYCTVCWLVRPLIWKAHSRYWGSCGDCTVCWLVRPLIWKAHSRYWGSCGDCQTLCLFLFPARMTSSFQVYFVAHVRDVHTCVFTCVCMCMACVM